MNIEELYGLNFAEYLKKQFLVGQVDPWRRTDDGKPLMVLLVTVDVALDECKEWSKQDISRIEFINYLKLNDILSFRNVDEFVKLKEEKKEVNTIAMKLKKNITPERRKAMQERARQMNELKHKV